MKGVERGGELCGPAKRGVYGHETTELCREGGNPPLKSLQQRRSFETDFGFTRNSFEGTGRGLSDSVRSCKASLGGIWVKRLIWYIMNLL